MPSVIYFTCNSADEGLTLNVQEDVEDLFEKLTAASGLPVSLTGVGRAEGTCVYVNPASIAFWRDANLGRPTHDYDSPTRPSYTEPK